MHGPGHQLSPDSRHEKQSQHTVELPLLLYVCNNWTLGPITWSKSLALYVVGDGENEYQCLSSHLGLGFMNVMFPYVCVCVWRERESEGGGREREGRSPCWTISLVECCRYGSAELCPSPPHTAISHGLFSTHTFLLDTHTHTPLSLSTQPVGEH